jgi:ankyrin repeat protein
MGGQLPSKYGNALGYDGHRIDIDKAKSIVTLVGVYATNTLGDTPLSLAASLGRIEVVNWLIDQGVDVNYMAPGSDRAALLRAADQKRIEVAACLVRAGANIEVTDRFGLAPLAAEVEFGPENVASVYSVRPIK